MKSSFRCQCGTLRGQVDLGQAYGRATCYCKYCQGYARMLDQERVIMNRRGGTELIATLPASIRFSAGLERLACVSLSDKGPLRWYADCCNTPIGNTPKAHKVPYVGLIRACLGSSQTTLDQTMGPVKVALNTESARGKVDSSPIATWLGMAVIFKNLLKARWSGASKKRNPFFVPGSGRPIQQPQPIKNGDRDAWKRSA